jgi:hypothetical protein
LDALQPPPGPALLSAQEAKDRLCEIVEGFFFRRLRTDDGGRVGRLLKSPPGLGKTPSRIALISSIPTFGIEPRKYRN